MKKPISPDKTRSTAARNSILNCLVNFREPVDYSQIMDYLKNDGMDINKTTVYRQLDSMVKNGLIQQIDLGEGKKRFEIISCHHHHLLCTNCNKIECIEFTEDLHSQMAQISDSTDFKITGHMLEFFGLCKNCQTKTNEVTNA